MSAYWALDRTPLGAAAALAVWAVAAAAWRLRRPSFVPGGVAIDAGGNWAVATPGGWMRFVPQRIDASPFGWLSLQGSALPVAATPASSDTVAQTLRFTLWSDSVSPADWRSLRIGAAWSTQRQTPLLMPAAAADSRLERRA